MLYYEEFFFETYTIRLYIIPNFLFLIVFQSVLQFLTTDLTMKLEWEELGQRLLFFSKCSVKASMKLYCSF